MYEIFFFAFLTFYRTAVAATAAAALFTNIYEPISYLTFSSVKPPIHKQFSKGVFVMGRGRGEIGTVVW